MSFITLFDPNQGRGIQNANSFALVFPELLIQPEDLLAMQAYAHVSSPDEVNGYALVKKLRPGSFMVVPGSVFITEQIVTPGSAEVTPAGIRAANKRHEEAPDGIELALQWHSHGRGNAYHSSTDLGTCESYGKGSVAPWRIWVVINDHGNIVARMEQYRPIRMGLPMMVTMISSNEAELIERAESDVDEFVTVLKPEPKALATPATTGTLFTSPEAVVDLAEGTDVEKLVIEQMQAGARTPDGAPCASDPMFSSIK